MNPAQWTEVDGYLVNKLVPLEPVLGEALTASAAAELPAINVAPNQGKFLQLLARITGARRILEIGTLGGYSTIWLARALPADGQLVTLEIDPKHAAVARANFVAAGVAVQVDLRVGPAAETLAHLVAEATTPFDFIFIDADKENIPIYFTRALQLARPGTVIVVDNVVRNGAVTDAASTDVSVQGVRKFMELAASEARVDATAVQTVGSKGYDGFALLRVKG
ncbi:MAG: O-methyltransferase [Cephaloticoccus sp.]|nr:O-methyltransferase [Cephaloticoccus sp.]MCF7759213.1 O-methyltransferase [Cephaloticoccus sp.]